MAHTRDIEPVPCGNPSVYATRRQLIKTDKVRFFVCCFLCAQIDQVKGILRTFPAHDTTVQLSVSSCNFLALSGFYRRRLATPQLLLTRSRQTSGNQNFVDKDSTESRTMRTDFCNAPTMCIKQEFHVSRIQLKQEKAGQLSKIGWRCS